MPARLNRRRFVQHSTICAAGAGGAAAGACANAAQPSLNRDEAKIECPWTKQADRDWLGPDVWANPMPDWRVSGQEAECINAAPNRNVQWLSCDLSDRNEPFAMQVDIRRVSKQRLPGPGSAGFTIGIAGPLDDFRNRLVFGKGLAAGLAMSGPQRGGARLFIGGPADESAVDVPLGDLAAVQLQLTGAPVPGSPQRTALTLRAVNPLNQRLLAETTRQVDSRQLRGNIAVTANYGATGRRGRAIAGVGQFAFRNWTLTGARLDRHPDRQFGPVFFTQYTVHRGVLKLTAQLPPLGPTDSAQATLELKQGDTWKSVATATIDARARVATFRVSDWDATRAAPYRVGYDWGGAPRYWEGSIRQDPVDAPELVVADISCNIHSAFPNAEYAARLLKVDPDLMAFTGDQFYESTGGYGVVRAPLDRAVLDYLHKWLIHGWTWRELTKNRPSVALPDDHDVYQGNIWGEGGAARQATQEAGGYTMPAEWVNVVHRTQTSHHPDCPDPALVQQGIVAYYGPLTYGGVSFAILADRMFKTGPDGVAPQTGGRADHVTDPAFNPVTADVPGAELLGTRQMKFLAEWAEDWDGATLKAVLSQTVFTSIATTHGANRQRLRADYDTNAWPQTARNEAVKLIRKTGAVHLAGDQHLPAVVRYGVEQCNDATVAFAGPAVNVGYPRWWEPEVAGRNRLESQAERKELGEFEDAFGHPMTMLAVFNPAVQPRADNVLQQMQEKGSGFGIVRFQKPARKAVIECWPYLSEPATDPTGRQFPGWPIEVKLGVQQGMPIGFLPTLRWQPHEAPLVKVFRRDVSSPHEELIYALRPAGVEFEPPVFTAGIYRVQFELPGRVVELRELSAGERQPLRVAVLRREQD
ncbi:MAG: alkaline phosphatase D family protein [Planctomycetales bacterium]|nr:alkaline phosphatase D family protein [Planctomycetales bacterium]